MRAGRGSPPTEGDDKQGVLLGSKRNGGGRSAGQVPELRHRPLGAEVPRENHCTGEAKDEDVCRSEQASQQPSKNGKGMADTHTPHSGIMCSCVSGRSTEDDGQQQYLQHQCGGCVLTTTTAKI